MECHVLAYGMKIGFLEDNTIHFFSHALLAGIKSLDLFASMGLFIDIDSFSICKFYEVSRTPYSLPLSVVLRILMKHVLNEYKYDL